MLGRVYFELYPTRQTQKPIDSIGFQVESLDTTIERLGEGCLHKYPTDSNFGRFAILRDPDSRLVHLTEANSKD